MRKLKLLETDLDQAEDQKADSDGKAKDLEAQVEELTRENKTLQNRVNTLEGKSNTVSQGVIQIVVNQKVAFPHALVMSLWCCIVMTTNHGQ